MNFLGGLIGGMATAASDKWKLDDEEARKEKLRQLDSELRIKEQATIDTLRQKAEQARAQRVIDQNKADSVTVQSGAQAMDTQRATGLINAKTSNVPAAPADSEFANKPITADDVANIRNNMSPENAKSYYGIDPVNNIQTMRDQGQAARNIGRLDMAKESDSALMAERQIQATEDANVAAGRRAATQDKIAANAVEKNRITEEKNDNWFKVMTQRLANNNGGGGSDASTAAIKTARAIQEDEKARGRDISLSQAIDLTHKAADEGNNYAMNYAKLQSDNYLIGTDKKDPTKPAPGKLYATPDDAIRAGRSLYVNSRMIPAAGDSATPVTDTNSKTSRTPTLPINEASAVNEAMKPPTSSSVPAGAVPIGRTPDGRTVYKTADGKQIAI